MHKFQFSIWIYLKPKTTPLQIFLSAHPEALNQKQKNDLSRTIDWRDKGIKNGTKSVNLSIEMARLLNTHVCEV